MNIKPMHRNFKVPTKGTERAGAFDVYMPTGGVVYHNEGEGVKVGLGFSAEVPDGFIALLLPRSGKGVNHGLALNNTAGVIDADYRGEWVASLRVLNHAEFSWEAGDRLIQFVLVPVVDNIVFNVVDSLSDTGRGEGGLGHTGL